jgi:hypothetical protein
METLRTQAGFQFRGMGAVILTGLVLPVLFFDLG